jgi:hypothetical protein
MFQEGKLYEKLNFNQIKLSYQIGHAFKSDISGSGWNDDLDKWIESTLLGAR